MDVMHVRTSERRAFKRCAQRWWWSYGEGLSSRNPSLALWFGSGIHEALAQYYQLGSKRDRDFIDVWRDYCERVDEFNNYTKLDDLGEEWVDSRKLGETMLTGYVKEYGGDPEWDVIATEQVFQVRISLDGEEDSVVQYDGTFDGVYRRKSDKRIFLMEHKTCKAMPRGDHLILDDQAGSYWAVAATILRNRGVLGKGENISGITYNYLRKSVPDERPVNHEGYATNQPTKAHYLAALVDVDGWTEAELKKKKLDELESIAAGNMLPVFGEVSKVQPGPLFWRKDVRRTRGERKVQIQRIKDEAAHMKKFRDGSLPIYKNPTMDCSWDCSFFEMCGLHEMGQDYSDLKKSVFVEIDPYEGHRKSA